MERPSVQTPPSGTQFPRCPAGMALEAVLGPPGSSGPTRKESWAESPAGLSPGCASPPIPGFGPRPGQFLKEPSRPGCCCLKPVGHPSAPVALRISCYWLLPPATPRLVPVTRQPGGRQPRDETSSCQLL